MTLLRARLRSLTLLPALAVMDPTRHLTESWPQLPPIQSSAESAPPSRAPKKLRAQIDEIQALLLEISGALEGIESRSCRENARVALAFLSERYESQRPSFLACVGSCRFVHVRLEEFVEALRGFETELAECRSSRSINKWLLEKHSGFDGSVAVQALELSNPRGYPDTSLVRAGREFALDLSVDGTYRSSQSWHSAEIASRVAMFRDHADEIEWSLRQENVLQLASHALRAELTYARGGEWLWSGAEASRALVVRQEALLGWRFVPSSGRATEILASYQSHQWDPLVWSLSSVGLNLNRVLSASLHDELKFVGGVASETYAQAWSDPLWVTRLGVLYERKGAELSTAHARIGLQDRRIAGSGASLWPDFSLGVEGRDALLRGLFPKVSLELSPMATPWAPHALSARSNWGLLYRLGRFELPVDLGIGRIFHRGLIGQSRDDMVVEAAMSPRWKLSSKALFSVPLSWTHFMLLRSDLASAATPVHFPVASFENIQAALRLQYDF
jgi:hypothetical protein